VESGTRGCRHQAYSSDLGHLKEELFHRVRFLNTDALASALHEYIRWYRAQTLAA